MSEQTGSAVHHVVVTSAGYSLPTNWSALRRSAAENHGLLSVVVLDGDKAINVVPTQSGEVAPTRLRLPRPTSKPRSKAWDQLLEFMFAALAVNPDLRSTEVHVFGDAATGRSLASLVREDTSIVIHMRDERPDKPAPADVRRTVPRESVPDAQRPLPSPTGAVRTTAPVPLPTAPRPPHNASSSSAPGGNATNTNGRSNTKKSFVAFGKMLGAFVPLWLLTPVVASFGTLAIHSLSTAVFAASENNGRTAGDGPVTLYVHLAWVLGLTCAFVLLLNLALGVTDGKNGWLPTLFSVAGIVAFFWLVMTRGGALWMWDVAPAAGVLGYLLAQIVTRTQRT